MTAGKWVAIFECFHRKRTIFKPRVGHAARCDRCGKLRRVERCFKDEGDR